MLDLSQVFFDFFRGIMCEDNIINQENKKNEKNKGAIEWEYSSKPVDYPWALAQMEARVRAIIEGKEAEKIWFLEHPPLITEGTSAKKKDLLEPNRFPLYKVGRGGEYTYHGPGQQIVYLMLDLKKRLPDIRAYIAFLEDWIIETLAYYKIKGEKREGRVGVWVMPNVQNKLTKESKIAAIGVRIRRWVSYHGVALNHRVNLSHFNAIVPCGIGSEYGVTSLEALGVEVEQKALQAKMTEILAEKLAKLSV